MARGLFDLIEGKMRDKDGYLEAFDAGFTEASNEKLSENGVNAVRTMNTLLHVFEAYTKYYAVSQDERAKEKCKEMIHNFLTHIWNPEKRRQEVFLTGIMLRS
jgi:mannobiose 2-epimerase